MKRTTIAIAALMLIFCSFNLAAGVQDKEAAGVPAKRLSQVPVEEQQKKATELFNTIYAISQRGERSAKLDEMIGLYQQIINDCPDVPLAQESSWRLIEMYFRDFNPPKKDEALSLFAQFKSRYPGSPLGNAVEGAITRALYLNGAWTDLLALTAPVAQQDPAKLESPLPVYYYAEAKYQLKDLKEAGKGYEIIVRQFPKSQLAGPAKARLDEINKAGQ